VNVNVYIYIYILQTVMLDVCIDIRSAVRYSV
jgi:hypothetical protein